LTEKRRVVAVIQARMNSSRLPGKVLLPLAGAPLLQNLIERVRRAATIDSLVVATSEQAHDDPIAKLCAEVRTICHRGAETDVLGRVLDAAEIERAKVLVRLTGDNPFVDGSLIDLIVSRFQAADPPVQYAHNIDDCGFPFGLYVEVADMQALHQVSQSHDPADREHVTWFLRQRPQVFRHLAVHAPAEFAEGKLSIDTREDYERLRPLFEAHARINPAFGYRDLLASAASAH
jgi:spore coat polysaccharide biosynthesis protein SpsF